MNKTYRWLSLSSAWLLLFRVGVAGAGLQVPREKVLFKDMVAIPLDGGPRSSPSITRAGLVWSQTITHPTGVTSVRVHIVVERGRQTADWRIVVRDLAGSEVGSFAGDCPEITARDFWTGEIPGHAARVELWSDSASDGLKITIDRYAYHTAEAIPQGIIGPDQRISIRHAPGMIQGWGRPVARLTFMSAEGQFHCSGFLLTSDLLVTNQHCLSTEAEALSATVEFDYDDFGPARLVLRAPTLVATSIDRDYSVVRFRKGRTAAGISPVTLGSAPLVNRQPLVVIGHPAGEPKQASIADCAVDGVTWPGVGNTLTDFGHSCDTLGGNSGSPVFDFATGTVVGLHHLGFAEGDPHPVNRAVQIGVVLDDLRQHFPAVYIELTGK
jgi:V8-like Glu-specific endopeptidase